jgi:hypothetical protein
MRTIVIVGSIALAFSMGILIGHAQSAEVTMRGTVKDANTVPEQIQYWEIRGSSGASISIIGDRDVPVIAWLRTAKERNVVLTISQ